ncbi:MAG TPA: MBOAT family O-acyltransferase, partial [Flavobacteriales bacterium]|nr:MBOAT family O-acyltransferase [Flavobacteriales bacterium]
LRGQRSRNIFLLLASYVFYGWWDPRFLSLLVLSSLIDFWVSLRLGNETRMTRRKALLLLSLTANLGMLGFFKYYDFFITNFEAAFSFFGHPLRLRHLDIILPVGISFYTFQTLSYTIDVYMGRLKPSTDQLSFMAFVSFFPQLVAGPIERATHLLPQFSKPRSFSLEQGIDGLRQMLWGLVKKVVVADNCAPYVDSIFAAPEATSGSTLLVGAILFSVQIYCDFSGYSDIAVGCARLFGFDL